MGKDKANDKIAKLRERLVYSKKLVWDSLTKEENIEVENLCRSYKDFLNVAKTERLAVIEIIKQAKKNGFEKYEYGKSQPKYYINMKNKIVALIVKGSESALNGVRLIASHVDSPRLDLKQNPLYEDMEIAFLKTHYYGGIKKYQWLSRPMALYGHVILNNGKTLDIAIGDGHNDPVFTISDILPHLARKQREKKLTDAFEGEKMNLVIGSRPVPDSDKDVNERIKLNILSILNEKYGLVEEDFISSEFEVVPAGKASDVGFDRSMIGAYGQDDRICAFTSLKALLETSNPCRTSIAIFYDKEEVGSDGATGAKSRFIETVMSNILKDEDIVPDTANILDAMSMSMALSADVNGAFDPDYPEVHEKRNAAMLGYGVCVTKFTGSGGKYSANDADAEYVGWIRNLFNKDSVVWQTGELGKIDEGGGGTIAKFLASHNIAVIDCGPPLLSMHAPFELSSKGDIFMTYKAYKSFFNVK